MGKLTIDDLNKIKNDVKPDVDNYIKVGTSTCGLAAGSGEVYDVLSQAVKDNQLNINVKKCGCVGMCFAEPLVEVKVEGMPAVLYGKVDRDVANRIAEEHLKNKKVVNDHIFDMNV